VTPVAFSLRHAISLGSVSRTNIGTELVRALCDYLALRGYFYWRNNTGAFKAAHGGFYRFGTPGSPDIMLIKGGKFIGIEAKAGSGRLSPAQIEFQRLCEANGGEYIVAHSIEELQAAGL
jgi:hypothetical protein